MAPDGAFAKRFLDSRNELNGQERVAAKVKKVVFNSDLLDSKDIFQILSIPIHRMRGDAYFLQFRTLTIRAARSRSTLPLGVSGSASISTNADGTCNRQLARQVFSQLAGIGSRLPPGTKYATKRVCPAPSPLTVTAHSARRNAPKNRLDSPNSTRNPRIFTCSSLRPRNSMFPSGRYRARSPVR